MFSLALHQVHVFPRKVSDECFSALGTKCMLCVYCAFLSGCENYCFVFSWKRTSAGVMLDGGKKVLEFVAIQRKDNSQWAIPGVSRWAKRCPVTI